jgi:predicted phosphodiesterase
MLTKINYKQKVDKNPLLLELNIFDLHLGKIAWSEETNHEYNLEIASSIFNQCIEEFLDEVSNKNIERIVFPIGNDFFNSDRSFPYNSTTKGTPQEEDARWQKTFRLGRQLLVEAINKLQQIAPVDVIMIPGNHDFERNFYLGDSLEGWFYNNENVTVDNSANPRKYYKYGEVLIGYTHGNEEKVTDLPLIMANEKPTDWALSTYREFHLGHLHHKKEIKFKSTEEYQGVIIRYFNSLSGSDSWHHKKGYIGAKRSAEALLWDPTKGLKNNIYFTL